MSGLKLCLVDGLCVPKESNRQAASRTGYQLLDEREAKWMSPLTWLTPDVHRAVSLWYSQVEVGFKLS